MLKIIIDNKLMFEGGLNPKAVIPSKNETLIFKTDIGKSKYEIHCSIRSINHIIEEGYNNGYTHCVEIDAIEEHRKKIK